MAILYGLISDINFSTSGKEKKMEKARKKARKFAQRRMGMGARMPVAGLVGLPKADITHAPEMVRPQTVISCGITRPIQRSGIPASGFWWQGGLPIYLAGPVERCVGDQ